MITRAEIEQARQQDAAAQTDTDWPLLRAKLEKLVETEMTDADAAFIEHLDWLYFTQSPCKPIEQMPAYEVERIERLYKTHCPVEATI